MPEPGGRHEKNTLTITRGFGKGSHRPDSGGTQARDRAHTRFGKCHARSRNATRLVSGPPLLRARFEPRHSSRRWRSYVNWTRLRSRGRQDCHIIIQDGGGRRYYHIQTKPQDCLLRRHSNGQTQSGHACHNGRKTRLQYARHAHGPHLHDQHAFGIILEPTTMHLEVGPQCKAKVVNHHPATIGAIYSYSTDTLQHGLRNGGSGAGTRPPRGTSSIASRTSSRRERPT